MIRLNLTRSTLKTKRLVLQIRNFKSEPKATKEEGKMQKKKHIDPN